MKMLVVSSVSRSEGARYSDVNEVMHIGRQRVYMLAVYSGGCCYTRCIVSLMEPGRQSFLFFFSSFFLFSFANNDQAAGYRV